MIRYFIVRPDRYLCPPAETIRADGTGFMDVLSDSGNLGLDAPRSAVKPRSITLRKAGKGAR